MTLIATYGMPLIVSLIIAGFISGYFTHFFLSKKVVSQLQLELVDMKKGQAQLRSDYNLLFQAMEGAKAQAEELQRKVYGTNVIEVTEHLDPEHVLNRQILAKFIYTKLHDDAQSDQSPEDSQPGSNKVYEALKVLDDDVVQILTKAIQ